jgi:hypothetical protein
MSNLTAVTSAKEYDEKVCRLYEILKKHEDFGNVNVIINAAIGLIAKSLATGAILSDDVVDSLMRSTIIYRQNIKAGGLPNAATMVPGPKGAQ